MSEAEFDSYLSLLSKFLRLRSRQRSELADELRDHLDSRLDELLAEGKSREQAIKIALDEFGDAAVLAEDFSRLASRRKRRFVMRCTAASAAVVASVVLLSIAFAPPGPNGPGPQFVVAQEEPLHEEAPPNDGTGNEQASIEQQAIAALDQKLGQLVPEVKFHETSLNELLQFVADAIDADVLVDEQGLEEEGITSKEPVTLVLTRTPVSARTVLEFVLDPKDLTFVNRAGVIFVTTEARAEELLITRVYNVRDLLENATTHATGQLGGMGGGGLGSGGMGGGGFFSVPAQVASTINLAQGGQLGGAGGGGGGGSNEEDRGRGDALTGSMGGMAAGMGGLGGGMGFGGMGLMLTGPAAELVSTIQQTTRGPWMDQDGAGGSISLFNGLLVVRQTEQNHAEVQKLLEALREAGRSQPGRSVTVPKEEETSNDAQEDGFPSRSQG